MRAGIRRYEPGDILGFHPSRGVDTDRYAIEEVIQMADVRSEPFTFYEKGTGRVLGCFGMAFRDGDDSAGVWTDVSDDMRKHCPVFMFKTILRHCQHARSRYGVSSLYANIAKDEARSIRFIERLGFELLQEFDEMLPGKHTYARSV